MIVAAVAVWLGGWALNVWLARSRRLRLARLLPPLVFGLTLLLLWELVVRGFGVSARCCCRRRARSRRGWRRDWPTLWADVLQTFIEGALSGYAIGCGAAFLVGIAVDRVPFLRRGLLPVGNFASALPIIGMAPIMVMWFGFDWQSKAAVVVLMVFFPMLVNTVQGLAAADPMQRDLMRTYAASYWPDAPEAAVAGGGALSLQRLENLHDLGFDRRHRGGVLRLADGRHGLSHLDRGRAPGARHGLGGDRRGGGGRVGLLRRGGADRAGSHLLAPVAAQPEVSRT